MRPPGALIEPGSAIERVDLYCGHCLPPWEIRDVRLELAPWSPPPLARGERYLCPCCGRPVDMLAQGQAGIPFTERYREERRGQVLTTSRLISLPDAIPSRLSWNK